MSHLSTERLAALGDEEPTAAEASHLAACADCARERSAYRTLVAMARTERDAIGIPLTRWDSIASALASEQSSATPSVTLISAPARIATPGRSVRLMRMPLRAAAGFLLLAGGAIAGRISAGAPPIQLGGAPGNAAATAASSTASMKQRDSATFASVEDARLAQLRSEATYQQAAEFLAEHDSAGAPDNSPEMVKSRLAALDQMISTTRAAMREAPHDPVINGYYLTTVGQREVALRQLNTALPASLRANSF
ncbi:MAG: hypothetical protein DMD35_17290 [Gemmatimonadetes bacterium]|nr:MAG: hypothetical protein DMD35_17290 [Gemmatimonadota bacterium]